MRIKCWIMAAAGPAVMLFGMQAQAHPWQVQPCDVDDYITKAIGIEEPWLESAVYWFVQTDNNGSPRALTLSTEFERKFSDRLGMELDLPAYTPNEPLGQGQGDFGPMAAGLKFAALHTCNLSEGRASLLTVKLEGQYWANTRPSVLPGGGQYGDDPGDVVAALVSLVHPRGGGLHTRGWFRCWQWLVRQHQLGSCPWRGLCRAVGGGGGQPSHAG